MFLLDTNFVSELRRREQANPGVRAWALAHALDDQFISVVTVLELEIGILQKERKDKAQGAILRTWLQNKVLPSFSERILDIDDTVALRCARLRVPDPVSDRDALIAATALVHGMTLISRNVADFEATGVKLHNPWS